MCHNVILSVQSRSGRKASSFRMAFFQGSKCVRARVHIRTCMCMHVCACRSTCVRAYMHVCNIYVYENSVYIGFSYI